MTKLLKILRALWAHLMGKRFVKDFQMINGSAWWQNQEKKIVRSFQPITKFTAFCWKTEYSCKIYFPVKITELEEGLYEAEVKIHSTMQAEELEKWVEKMNDNPFV